jgi:dipeptidyl-peptidase 4
MPDLQPNYRRAEAFLPANALKKVYSWYLSPRWINNSDCFWYRVHTRRGFEFIYVDPAQKIKRPAFDHVKLAQALTQITGQPVEAYALPFKEIQFSEDENTIIFTANEIQYSFTIPTNQLSPSEFAILPSELVSPNGLHAAYIENHNLYLRNMQTNEITQLTIDGEEFFGYGEEPGGTMTSITDEMSGLQNPPAARWSPDSTKLFIFRCDEREIKSIHLLEHTPLNDSMRPKWRSYKYPMLEDKEYRTISYAVIDIENKTIVPVQIEKLTGMESPFYFERAGLSAPDFWSADHRIFMHARVNGYLAQRLYEINPETGEARLVIEETSNTPVLLNLFEFDHPNYRILTASNELIWFSERDGWAHLYLYDLAGNLKNQITRGEWVVRDILHVDEPARQIYFTASGMDSTQDPYLRHLYRINFDGTNLKTLTHEDAEHLLTASPSGKFFVDVYGRVDKPSVSVVRDSNGQPILPLEETDESDLTESGFRFPIPFSALAADGQTPTYGVLYLPSDFDVNKKYPVLDAIYGWSQLTVVPRAFLLDTGSPLGLGVEIAAENYFVPQSIAELGFMVVVIDGRGTPYRSRTFRDIAYTDPTMSAGIEDHIAAIQQLAEEYPSMDINCVGIFGHSGGGHNTAKALMRFPDFFKVGVASAGAYEMASYHAGWAEMWSTDAEKLRPMSVSTYSENLKGKLLLAHGDMDENVHPLQLYRLMEALINANKDFDLLILPNRNHDFTLDPYFVRRRWDYFVQHLLCEEPPTGLVVNPGNWNDVI